MSSATLTSPPIATARLVVDTDVASFIFKWHPEFAPRYVDIVRGSELIVSFMTVAEMRQGALDANWGPRKMRRAGSLSRRLLSPSFGQPVVLHVGRRSEREYAKGPSDQFCRRMDRSHGAGALCTAGDEQSQGLPPWLKVPGQLAGKRPPRGVAGKRTVTPLAGNRREPPPIRNRFHAARNMACRVLAC